MLVALEVENFKGIGDAVRIDLRPITLLFGPNSAGKSTVLHALLYAREVLERSNVDADRTIEGGERVDLGGFESLAHGRSRENPIRIRFDFINTLKGFPERMLYSGENYYSISEGYHDGLESQFERCWIEVVVAWSDQIGSAFAKSFEVGADGRRIGRIEVLPGGREARIAELDLQHPLITYNGRPDPSESSEYALPSSSDPVGLTSTRCGTGTRSALPRWDSALEIIRPSEKETRDRARAAYPRYREAFNRAVEDLSPGVTQAETLAGSGEGSRSDRESEPESDPEETWIQSVVDFQEELWSPALEERLSLLFVGIGRLGLEELRGLRYLGPIREVPRRGYAAPRSPLAGRWASGLAAWDLLLTEEATLAEKVGRWLERLHTGYGLRVDRFREVADDSLVVRLLRDREFPKESLLDLLDDLRADLLSAREKKRVLLVSMDSDVVLEPYDVGVGLSQVVPVVVAALGRDGSGAAPFVAIEQPELHVHPGIQVELGDLFASAIGPDGPTFLLETHSEHLMLRLLRRIEETHSGELPPEKPQLKPDQVSVVFVEQIAGQMKATPLRIDATGEFIDRWPRGFFEERAEELF